MIPLDSDIPGNLVVIAYVADMLLK